MKTKEKAGAGRQPAGNHDKLTNSIPQDFYVCIKCKAKVYVKPDHHAFVCSEYRKRAEGAR